MLKRYFSSTQVHAQKHYVITHAPLTASTPYTPLPQATRIKVHRLPPALTPPQCPTPITFNDMMTRQHSLRRVGESSVFAKEIMQNKNVVEITGPHGSGFVPVPEYITVKIKAEGQEPVDIAH